MRLDNLPPNARTSASRRYRKRMDLPAQDLGFRGCRVRYHDRVARLELDLGDLPRLREPFVREAVLAAGRAQ